MLDIYNLHMHLVCKYMYIFIGHKCIFVLYITIYYLHMYIYTYKTGIFLLNRKRCLKCSPKEKLFYTAWYNPTIDNYGSIENYIIENYLIQWEKCIFILLIKIS